jgi:hypothetical protein
MSEAYVGRGWETQTKEQELPRRPMPPRPQARAIAKTMPKRRRSPSSCSSSSYGSGRRNTKKLKKAQKVMEKHSPAYRQWKVDEWKAIKDKELQEQSEALAVIMQDQFQESIAAAVLPTPTFQLPPPPPAGIAAAAAAAIQRHQPSGAAMDGLPPPPPQEIAGELSTVRWLGQCRARARGEPGWVINELGLAMGLSSGSGSSPPPPPLPEGTDLPGLAWRL